MTRSLPLAIAVLLGTSLPALAHAPIKGIGAFYNGLLHPLFVPSHLLVLIALGLLIGQRAPATSRHVWFGFVAGLGIALIVGPNLGFSTHEPALLGLAMFAGLLAIIDRPYPRLVVATLGLACGLGLGLDSMPEAVNRQEFWLALTGTGLGAILFLSYLGGIVAVLQRPWQRLGIRVAASWTVACAIIVLAFAVATPTTVG